MAEKLSRVVLIETALAGLVERIAVIEKILGGLPTDEPVVAGCGGDRRLSKTALARRWGKSTRSIDRMRERPDFPTPDVVNKACVWWLSTIQQYERETQTGGETETAQFRGQTGARHGPKERANGVSSED
jgi:hypothetical protein